MEYRVSHIIQRGWDKAYTVDRSGFAGAHNLVQTALNHGEIALVQGPPGTGKTTIYESILHDNIDRLANGNPVLYIAPTNQLVADMLERIASVYRHIGKNPNDIRNEIRVYGSYFTYDGQFDNLNDRLVDDDGVKLVISTDWQRIATNVSSTFHLMIDEASKSPLQKPFISITDSLARSIGQGRQIIDSISVIGDPKQAISLGDYRNSKELLIMNSLIRGLLPPDVRVEVEKGQLDLTEAAYNQLKGSFFEFLEATWRMPKPSETPISRGYYNGRLVARVTAKQRLRGLWDSNPISYLRSQDRRLEAVATHVENAISTHRPMIYARIEASRFNDEDSPYDPVRAQVGVQYAVVLAMITGRSTGVVTTYVQQMNQMELMYKRHYRAMMRDRKLDGLVSFSTTQRMLGSQRDNIVAVLGKEWPGSEDKPTTYFREPELLNVQLSRHQGMLVVVGNLTSLINSVVQVHQARGTKDFTSLKDTAETIFELAGLERRSSGRSKRIKDGDGCVYAPYDMP